MSLSGIAIRTCRVKLQIANLQQEVTVAGDDVEVSTQTESNLDIAALDRNTLDNAPIFDQNYIATISRFLDSGAVGTNGTALIMDGLQVNNIPSGFGHTRIENQPESLLFRILASWPRPN